MPRLSEVVRSRDEQRTNLHGLRKLICPPSEFVGPVDPRKVVNDFKKIADFGSSPKRAMAVGEWTSHQRVNSRTNPRQQRLFDRELAITRSYQNRLQCTPCAEV